MKILALDPATQTGWAHSEGPCGSWDLSVKHGESCGMRLIKLRTNLDEIKQAVCIDLLVFEEGGFSKGRWAASLAGEIRGQIQVWCEDNKINYRTYTPTEIKKFATDNGRASKTAMLEAAKSKLNYQGHDTDTADALWLLALAEHDYAN